MSKCFYAYERVYWESSRGEKYFKPIWESVKIIGVFHDRERAIDEIYVRCIEDDFHEWGHLEDGWKARIHMYVVSEKCDKIIAERTYKEEDYEF